MAHYSACLLIPIGLASMVSTAGCTMILVGPSTYFPLNAFVRKQTAISASSTEAEVIAANQALRAEGLPALSLFCKMSMFGKDAHSYASRQSFACHVRRPQLALTLNLTRSGMVTSIQATQLPMLMRCLCTGETSGR